jgi:hypothetical protein
MPLLLKKDFARPSGATLIQDQVLCAMLILKQGVEELARVIRTESESTALDSIYEYARAILTPVTIMPHSLLAHCAGDEDVGWTLGVAWCPAFEQEPPGAALLLRLSIKALSGCKALAAAQRRGRRLTIGYAVRRRIAPFARDHNSCVRQSDNSVGCILGDFARLGTELVQLLLSTQHVGLEFSRSFFQPLAERIDETRLLGSRTRFLCSGRRIGDGAIFLRKTGPGDKKRAGANHHGQHVRCLMMKNSPQAADHLDPVCRTQGVAARDAWQK